MVRTLQRCLHKQAQLHTFSTTAYHPSLVPLPQLHLISTFTPEPEQHSHAKQPLLTNTSKEITIGILCCCDWQAPTVRFRCDLKLFLYACKAHHCMLGTQPELLYHLVS